MTTFRWCSTQLRRISITFLNFALGSTFFQTSSLEESKRASAVRLIIKREYGSDRRIFWLTGQQKSLEEKQENLTGFKKSSNPAAILLTVGSTGGIGINIVEASVCIFLTISWNPQVDMQCLSRCWRWGNYIIISMKMGPHLLMPLFRAGKKSERISPSVGQWGW